MSSEVYMGSEPLERATWFNLTMLCYLRENSGIIADCSDWGDRKWMTLCGVTKNEVNKDSSLYTFKQGSLHIWGYDMENQKKVEASRINGRKGGRPPKNNPALNLEITQPLPNPNLALTQDEPRTNPKGKSNNKGNGNSKNNTAKAEEVYFHYPKKTGKKAAIKSIENALKVIKLEDLLPIVVTYGRKTAWMDKQYIPNPATWFNQERWEDDQSLWDEPKQQTEEIIYGV